MKSEDLLDFESLPSHKYIEYLNKAEKIQQMGLHLNKDVIELANKIYINTSMEANNESKIN